VLGAVCGPTGMWRPCSCTIIIINKINVYNIIIIILWSVSIIVGRVYGTNIIDDRKIELDKVNV
jgi:hypothetical protein